MNRPPSSPRPPLTIDPIPPATAPANPEVATPAGIDRLQELGSFGTYVEIARSGALGNTIDDVLKQPVRVVYTLLLYDCIKSKYEKNLSEILKQTKK